MKEEKNVIYTYRYMFQTKSSDKINILLLSGSMEQILDYDKKFALDDTIVSCCRIYQSEIDLSFIDIVESVKICNKEIEKNEEIQS